MAEASDSGSVDDVVVDLGVVGVDVELDSPAAALGVVPATEAVGTRSIPDPVIGDGSIGGVVEVDPVVELIAAAPVVDLVVGNDDTADGAVPGDPDPDRTLSGWRIGVGDIVVSENDVAGLDVQGPDGGRAATGVATAAVLVGAVES